MGSEASINNAVRAATPSVYDRPMPFQSNFNLTRFFIFTLQFSLFAFVLFATACKRTAQPAPTPPTTPRIVALSPAAAVTLRDLGLESKIVGRHAYDMVLDPALPSCGDQLGLDFENLLRVQPTHIVIQWGKRDLPSRLTELAAEHSWTITTYDPLTLADLRADTQRLAGVFAGAPGFDAANAAHVMAEFDRAFAKRSPDLSRAGKVLLLWSASPPAALGPGSWHHQILQAIGGRPAIGEGAASIALDQEDALRLAPDAIVLVVPRDREAKSAPSPAPPMDAETRAKLLGPLAALDLPAIRTNHVALLDDPLAHTPSTAMIRFADELAEVLVAWSP